MKNDERCTVASRESGYGLQNTILSTGSFAGKRKLAYKLPAKTGDIRGITGKEVVASLLRGELSNRRKDTEGIASQHDDVAGLPVDHARDLCARDVLNRVRASRVLGDRHIVVVGDTGRGVVHDVFEDTTESDGTVDLGLLLRREVNGFGVASTFNVENTFVRPDVLVVSDELASGIGREGSLSSAGETEEQGDIAVVDTDIGRRVQRQLSELHGLQVVLNSVVV